MSIDINCDMGESFGSYSIGEDEKIIAFVTSANIACGYHAGDPLVMARTVSLAKSHGVSIGAHPGYPDLMGYGRRRLQTFPGEIKNYLLYQMGALSAFTRAAGVKMRHIKPHGALYNHAAQNEEAARELIEAVKVFNPELFLYTLSGSLCAEMAESSGLRVIREVFPDRAYLATGQLAPRTMEGSILHDQRTVQQRVVKLIREGRVAAMNGQEIALRADTLCVHGDTPGASRLAREILEALKEAGIKVAPPCAA